MRSIIKIYNNTSLILRIVIGMIIGAILALIVPKVVAIGIMGQMFVGALRAIAPILVFILVLAAISQAGTGIGKQFRTVIFLYLLNTFLAAILAVIVSFLYPVKLRLTEAAADQAAPDGIAEVLKSLLNNCVDNPINALATGNYLGILFWSALLGFALKIFATDSTKALLNDFSKGVTTCVRWVINMAPFGICGLVFISVSENGLEIFTDYGRLLISLLGSMVAMVVIIIPIIVFCCLRKNPYPLILRCCKDSGITAFFTRSSAANIPVNMRLCENLGLDRDFYSVSIPLGATVNMNGAAITITILTLAAAYTMGIHVDIPSAIILSVLAAVAACGCSGVAGGSLMLIPLACSLFGIPAEIAMQVVGVGFIIGVLQDSTETALNSSGDVIFAATAEFIHRKKNGENIDISFKGLRSAENQAE